ncbi:MAG TPA: GNAT family N-acetyltransferase [Spirochaetia bacterium]|nr:GNAT family N-acetyltransferase [Spirochaetales bacterium]HRZ90413.1 GNAT family N-acetyltransferase [Spirochaetia bacterium]
MSEKPDTEPTDPESQVVPVTEANLEAFLSYCSLRGPEHDESFLPGAGFRPDADHPSFLLLRDGRPAGAASLLLESANRAARRARFAILHAEGGRRGYFALLGASAAAAAPHAGELFLFLPEARAEPLSCLREAGFAVERLSFEMARDDPDLEAPEAPSGYRLEPLRPGDGEGIRAYVEVRNRNFREVLGSLPIDEGTVRADLEDPGIPSGGLAVLRAPDGSACGTMRAERDTDPECLSIGALSVDREHRGRDLGRFLLRSAAALGRREGFRTLSLSVNALNKNALGLYESEGFTVRGTWVCLSAPVPAVLGRTAPGAGEG